MISYLGSLVQFSPAAGRAGRCRQISPRVDSTHRVRPHWVCPVQGRLCFPVYIAQAPGCSIWSGPCVECGSSIRVLHKSADSVAPACCVFPGLSGSGSQRLARPLPVCGAPFPSTASVPGSQRIGRPLPGVARLFPPRPQGTPPVGSQEVLRQTPEASLQCGRGWLLWG